VIAVPIASASDKPTAPDAAHERTCHRPIGPSSYRCWRYDGGQVLLVPIVNENFMATSGCTNVGSGIPNALLHVAAPQVPREIHMTAGALCAQDAKADSAEIDSQREGS
jgi:hypothetical protein